MLLKRRPLDHKTATTWGQFFLLLGILISRISAGGFLEDWLRDLLASESMFNTFQGFVAGLSIPLLGLSIYLNLKGLQLSKSLKSKAK